MAPANRRRARPATRKIVDRRELAEARPDLACTHLHPIAGNGAFVTLRQVTTPLSSRQEADPHAESTLWIVAGPKSQLAQTRCSLFRSRLTSRRLSRRKHRIEASYVLPTFSVGERWGRLLRARRPASPSCSYRRSHLRRVGRETPMRRHTAPAPPSPIRHDPPEPLAFHTSLDLNQLS